MCYSETTESEGFEFQMLMTFRRAGAMFVFSMALGVAAAAPAAANVSHGISMHGDLAYPPGFDHFRYVEPEAPRGGRLTIGVQGSFDSLNPLIVRGVPARGLREYVFESLLARSYDEPFSLYGLLAETVETPDDRSWVEFTLHQEARFSDGQPVTVEDVLFSWEVLKEKGRPNHRTYYGQVSSAEATGERTVRFEFEGDPPDREMPLIMGLMPILPRHHYAIDTFEDTGLSRPLGSGPYVISEVAAGSAIMYRRNPDYWGDGLPVTRGLFNFDEVRFDYYRDANTMFEAFKRGLSDIRPEDDPGRWATGYDFPAVTSGRVILDEFESQVPRGMSAFVFNTRRPHFSDVRVREALLHLFDAEWINRNLYHGLYERTGSYFDGSELSFLGHPASDHERAVLGPWIEQIDPAILDGSYVLPSSDGSGRDRTNMRRALALLEEAGYALDQGTMRNAETGAAFSFEILVVTRDQERLALSFQRALQRVRHRGRRASGGFGPVRAAAADLRLRHDPELLGGLPVAGERTEVLLGQRRGGGRRHAQLHGRGRSRRRPGDRSVAGRGRSRDLRPVGTRARPGTHGRRLRRAPVPPAEAMGGTLRPDRAPGYNVTLRLPDRHVVAGLVGRLRRDLGGGNMILTDRDRADRYAQAGLWGKMTLDGLLARSAAARPDEVALVDAGDRAGWERPFPRSLTWRALDRRVSALSAVLLDAGLKQDEIVALQLANTVELFLACLAVLRAGLIAAPMPQLWRRHELGTACRRIAPAALLTASRIGPVAHGELLRDVAVDTMSVRHVFAFGKDVPDGLQPLDAIVAGDETVEGGQGLPRAGNAADHVAMVTFDSRDPSRPLARSHNQWLSAATVAVLAARLSDDAAVTTALPPASLPGVACGLGAWLLSGCRLSLAMPGDPEVILRELAAGGATHLALPGRVAASLAPARDGPRLIRVWRDPLDQTDPHSSAGIDIVSLGEIALHAVQDGDPGEIPLESGLPPATDDRLFAARMQGMMQRAGSVSPGALLRGALLVGGPQLPGAPLPVPADQEHEADPTEADGYRPSGLRCRLTAARPPVARIVGHVLETFVVGGVCVHAGEVDEIYRGFPGAEDAAAIAVADETFGHRILAAVVPGPDCDLSATAFRAYLDGLGAAPYFVPDDIISVSTIPRGSDGLVLRSALDVENAA